MAELEYNKYANPKVKTKYMKYYFNVGGNNEEKWELQGRGVESWSEEFGSEIEKTKDVLGKVDMERGDPEPTQSITLKLRSDNEFSKKIAEADLTGDTSFFDDMQVLKKYEFLDGKTDEKCKAKLEKGVCVEITTRNAEAGGYIEYELTLNYANDYVVGEMDKVDGATIKFTPDSAA